MGTEGPATNPNDKLKKAAAAFERFLLNSKKNGTILTDVLEWDKICKKLEISPEEEMKFAGQLALERAQKHLKEKPGDVSGSLLCMRNMVDAPTFLSRHAFENLNDPDKHKEAIFTDLKAYDKNNLVTKEYLENEIFDRVSKLLLKNDLLLDSFGPLYSELRNIKGKEDSTDRNMARIICFQIIKPGIDALETDPEKRTELQKKFGDIYQTGKFEEAILTPGAAKFMSDFNAQVQAQTNKASWKRAFEKINGESASQTVKRFKSGRGETTENNHTNQEHKTDAGSKMATLAQVFNITETQAQQIYAYAEKQFSTENLNFLIALKDLEKNPSPERIQEVLQNFIKAGSENEINFEAKDRRALLEKGKQNPSIEDFDKAKKQVLSMLKGDQAFKALLESFKPEQKQNPIPPLKPAEPVTIGQGRSPRSAIAEQKVSETTPAKRQPPIVTSFKALPKRPDGLNVTGPARREEKQEEAFQAKQKPK